MRSNKRYTNVTFTKRVDHEAGRKHPPRALAEPKTCERCGAVYKNRRWVNGRTVLQQAVGPERTRDRELCPACRRIVSGAPGGYVRLDGSFLKAHLDEINTLLQNEQARAAEDNPTARVMTWRTLRGPRIELTTTTPHLAQRLGHAVQDAYGGKVDYDFSHENELARVHWSREQE